MITSEIVIFNVENKSFCFNCSHLHNASLFTFIAEFFKSPLSNKDYRMLLPCRAWYIFTLVHMIFALTDQYH